MMMKQAVICIAAFILLLMAGCAGMQRDYEEPQVHLTRIAPLPGAGLEQRFLVGLRIVNPNRGAINISGLSYGLKLQGQQVVSGVSSNIPRVPGYGEAEVELEAATNLLGAARLLSGLMSRPVQAIDYELEAKLDIGRFAVPVRVKESGAIQLGVTPGGQ